MSETSKLILKEISVNNHLIDLTEKVKELCEALIKEIKIIQDELRNGK